MTQSKNSPLAGMSPAIASSVITMKEIAGILNKIDYTVIISTMDGDIVFANKFFLNWYKVTMAEVVGRKVFDPFLQITSKEHFMKTEERAIANGGSLKLEREIKVDHTIHYHETTIIMFEMDGEKRILYFSKDITDLKNSQTHTRELNQMLNKIIDNLPVYLFVKDVDNELRYLIWNKAFADSAKIPAEKVIGRTDFEVFPDFRNAQAFRNDDLHVIENGEMTMKQENYMAADGKTRVVQTYKTLVQREGRGPLLVGISLDVTDIQGIEDELVQARLRAEESDRLKTRFLANMSHEIRTPLNAIVGFSGMLSDVDDEESRQQFLKIISENSELLLQLINDILDLSKIEAGTLDYVRAPMDLYDTCVNQLLIYKEKESDRVKIFFDNEESPCEFIVNEDRNRLVQVLDNLLNNAVKFTKEGEIHYGFQVKGEEIEVYVSDTGKGIPQDKLEEVFNRFVKLDNFTQGSGLGLPICQLIVNTLGGKIWATSEEGKGSTFRFTIPYKAEDLQLETGNESKPVYHQPSGKADSTILIAEDVHSNFLVVKTMIKGRYDILWAKDGIEAVELAREKHPDLILMDIKMPGMNGINATREIRKFDKDVPIVAMTANAFDEDRVQSRNAGMNNFLPKPINRDAFEAILNAYLPSKMH